MRTDSYVMTAHTECAGDMLELENIRKVVKMINAQNKKAEDRHNRNPIHDDIVSMPRYYVKCQGRGPRTKPSILDGRGFRGYDQSLPLRHATHMDVYIYERYTW